MNINLLHTPEEELLQREARDFYEREAMPHVIAMDQRGEFPFQLLRKMGERHYIGVRFPSEYGGGGSDLMAETIVNEETGAVSLALSCARSVPHHATYGIWRHGTEVQKRQYLPDVFAARKIIAECITEPEVGSDAVRMKTRAVRDGSEYVITGEKRFQAGGGVADLFVVWAVTDPKAHPSHGMSAFVVERARGNIFSHEEFSTMGYRGLRTVSELIFNGARIPAENLVGEENRGFDILVEMLDHERVIVAAALVGSARTCLDVSARYSAERKAFHRPIREFEGISFKIADMAVSLEAARVLTVKATRMLDQGLSAAKVAAMAKLFASETATTVSSNAMQILGGIGYTDKFPVERHFRDARLPMIAAGTSEIMRLIIQREVYKESGLA